MEEQCYTLGELKSTKILGRTKKVATLKKVIADYKVPSVGLSVLGKPLYKLEDIENAFKQYMEHMGTAKPDDEDGANELFNLRKLKIKKEIEALTQDIQKKDLQIEQLKLQLVDTKEALQYFTQRKAVESAILRRIFLTQMPIEVTGLDPAKARAKGEHYYNEIMKVVTSTIDTWADIYNLENEGIKETVQTTPESS